MKSIRELTEGAPIALLYFFSEDCAPCITLRKKIRDLLDERFPHIPLVMLDGKNYPELMQEHLIVSFPTALLMADGREFRRYGLYSGIQSIADDISRLESLMSE
jgi:thioredoxin-like negative regulator of GroEL